MQVILFVTRFSTLEHHFVNFISRQLSVLYHFCFNVNTSFNVNTHTHTIRFVHDQMHPFRAIRGKESIISHLANLDRNRMLDILKAIYFVLFSWMQDSDSCIKCHYCLFLGPNWQQVIIGPGNGLAPNRHRALPDPMMTCTTDAYIYHRDSMC